MKKAFKKLTLNKMTISNLNTSEMNQKLGGAGKTTNNTVTCSNTCTPESVYCWTEKCVRFTHRVTCTSL